MSDEWMQCTLSLLLVVVRMAVVRVPEEEGQVPEPSLVPREEVQVWWAVPVQKVVVEQYVSASSVLKEVALAALAQVLEEVEETVREQPGERNHADLAVADTDK